MVEAKATKHDSGKPRMSLIDPLFLTGVAQVLTFGAEKYSQYGECNCHVRHVQSLVSFGPRDFAKAAITYQTLIDQMNPKRERPHIRGSTETRTEINSPSMVSSVLSQLVLSGRSYAVDTSSGFTQSQIANWIDCLHREVVLYARAQTSSVLTTTTQQEKCETDFVRAVTSLLDSLRKSIGHLEHEHTCPSGELIKTGAHNWRNGLSSSRVLDAALRHIASFNDGEDVDPESGVSHLAHAACNLMFALRMLKDRPDLDDRYSGKGL